LKICPKLKNIRRTKEVGSDRVNLTSTNNLASIRNIIINIDEPVAVRFLGFHINNVSYCKELKITNEDKKYCEMLKSQYVHIQLVKEGFPEDQSQFIIAFLPRIKLDHELEIVVKEICDVIEWLEIKQTVNCIIFRFGKPVHNTEDTFKWQRQLDKVIKQVRNYYMIGQINGLIKQVRQENEKCLTVSAAYRFESINVS